MEEIGGRHPPLRKFQEWMKATKQVAKALHICRNSKNFNGKKPNSSPLFCGGLRENRVVQTCKVQGNQCTLEVLEEENPSDHQYLKIRLQTNTDTYSYLRFKTAFGGHCRFIKNFRSHVNILFTAIAQAQSKQDLDQATEELRKDIFNSCLYSYKIKGVAQSPQVKWWRQEF
ncbi:hypothetical protein AVEN_188759-1 [Araneus ventricosus]|uniref:Uncharacterized protein n=1 Tax=Araneus ventricosus TaxID=182803 RepID=A0A4Y2S9E2_ARAVE|nr:hypothetical protein AVEN_188759-1 [Araneus ventricosus]